MSSPRLELENTRKCLSEAILGELESWPNLHRQVFVLTHYRGQPPEKVSSTLGMTHPEVRQILAVCERKLRTALRDFRDIGAEGDLIPENRTPMESGTGYLF